MTESMRRFGALALVLTAAGCASMGGGGAAPATPAGPTSAGTGALRARPGDTVYFVQHYVRPERRQQFEDFVLAVLWPAFERAAASAPARRDLARGVRLLQPTHADADGNFTYTFVLDPYVRGESYNVLELLQALHPQEEALRQYSRFTETWARDFTTHTFVQFLEPARK